MPSVGTIKKVKSMQVFHQPVVTIAQGDRAGICLPGLDPHNFERGLIGTPGTLPSVSGVICSMRRIKYYQHEINNGQKYHISVGHSTVMGTISLLEHDRLRGAELSDLLAPFDFSADYRTPESVGHFVLIDFEEPIIAPVGALVIGSKLDSDIHAKTCRLAFHGHVLITQSSNNNTFSGVVGSVLPESGTNLRDHIKLVKTKTRSGVVDRVESDSSIIIRDLISKGRDVSEYINKTVYVMCTGAADENQEESKLMQDPFVIKGTIESAFGKSGKLRVVIKRSPGQTAAPSPNNIVKMYMVQYK